jgi:hypothetical protein
MLGTVQPDLLAEALAVEVLRGCTAEQRTLVLSGLSVGRAVQALTVLGRAVTHQPDAPVLIDAALAVDVPRMTEAVLRVAPQLPGRFTPRLIELLAAADLDLDWARRVAGRIAYPSLELGRVALALTTRIVAGLDTTTPASDRATWVSWHAVRLAEVGRRAEALTASQEALDLYQELAAGNRDAYLPGLANSLWNVGYVAHMLGETSEQIVAAVTESVQHFNALAAAEPGAFTARRDAASATLAQLQAGAVRRPAEATLSGAPHDDPASGPRQAGT